MKILEEMGFWRPLNNRKPKWWLILAILIINGFISNYMLQASDSAIMTVGIILLLALFSLFIYCLYFKLFENEKR